MKTSTAWIVGIVLATATVWWALPVTGADDDTAAVKARLEEFVAAWNRHDAKALAAIHAEDADATAAPGRAKKLLGRAEIEKSFVETLTGKGAYRDSTLETTIDSIRFPTPDIAISDKTAVVTGAYGPDGSKSPPSTLDVTEVWKKTDGQWLIYACRIHMKPAPPAGT